MRYILLGFLCLQVFFIVGQTVTITGKSDGNPLEYVSVYDESRQHVLTSDFQGRVEIGALLESDTIFFQLMGYKILRFTPQQLESQRFRVSLPEEDFTLNEVIISASRWEHSKSATPAKVVSIRPSEVRFSNPQTAADMLGASGHVFIQKSQLGGGSPMIRGFSANRVLISVDGVRMNNAIFRSGNLQNILAVDPFSLERTEVIFGPGSILYGSDALGGVMAFYTKTPHLSENGKFALEGSAYARYSSANEEKTAHLDLGYGIGKFGFISSASFSDFGDQRMGSNGPDDYLRHLYVERINGRDTVLSNSDPEVQVPSGYSQVNLMQKVLFRPNDALQFHYNFHLTTSSDVPRYDRLIEFRNGTLRDGDWYYGPQEWQMHQLQANVYEGPGFFDKLRVIGAYQRFGESRHNRSFGSETLNHRTESVDVFSLNFDFEKDLGDNTQLFYGLEGLYNKVGSTAFEEDLETGQREPISTRYPDGADWQSYAAYFNCAIQLSPQWSLLGGLRYNIISLHADFDTAFFPFPFTTAEIETGALNASAGIVYTPWEDWQFKLNVSSGFRAPNIDDLGKVFDSEPGAVVVPNPELNPEYAYNFDLGITKRFDDHVMVELTAFTTFLEDALVRRNYQLNGMDSIFYDGELSRVTAIQNAAQARVWGFQAGLDWKVTPEITCSARVNFQDGWEKDQKDAKEVPLRHAAPTFGLLKLEYERKGIRVALSGQFSGELSAEDLAPSEVDKPHLYASDSEGNPYSPSWYTINLKASYNLNDQLQLLAGLENITDQRYRPYSSGIAGPGRNLILAARAEF